MLDLLKMLKKKFGSATVVIMPHGEDMPKDNTPKMVRMMMKSMATKNDMAKMKKDMPTTQAQG